MSPHKIIAQPHVKFRYVLEILYSYQKPIHNLFRYYDAYNQAFAILFNLLLFRYLSVKLFQKSTKYNFHYNNFFVIVTVGNIRLMKIIVAICFLIKVMGKKYTRSQGSLLDCVIFLSFVLLKYLALVPDIRARVQELKDYTSSSDLFFGSTLCYVLKFLLFSHIVSYVL